jgi:hypothetical protein
MPKLVASGAKLECSQGLSQSSLNVPFSSMDAGPVAAATVMDHIPLLNIAPFGMCKTQANPMVAAATAAAAGVLTPQPCIPVVLAPWAPGCPTMTISDHNALTADSQCTCLWTGQISITDPASDIDVG